MHDLAMTPNNAFEKDACKRSVWLDAMLLNNLGPFFDIQPIGLGKLLGCVRYRKGANAGQALQGFGRLDDPDHFGMQPVDDGPGRARRRQQAVVGA